MTDLPPDLPRLRTLETWLAMQLAAVRRAIEAAERREQERQRGIAARPPTPDWMIEQSIGQGPAVYVHVGGCPTAGKRSKATTRDAALRALANGIDACPHCRPDNELGYIDG